MDDAVKQNFVDLFVKHYERLTNSRQSVGGLAFTMENIICFILLGGRELDIEDIFGDVSERYSLEELLADARDAGIQEEGEIKKTISDLLERKFIHLQPDGKFYAYQATRDTARMLNRIYPRMEGLSLLAYIGQTLQEVESGRIELAAALSRFDQTLQHHGLALPKPKIPSIAPPPAKPAAGVKKPEELKPSSPRIIRDYVVTDAAAKARAKDAAAPPPKETPVIEPARPAAPPASPSTEPLLEETPEISEPSAPASESDAAPIDVESPAEKTDPPLRAVEETPAEPETLDDEAIAAKVAAFEKELALVCPICKTNVLTEKKTAAGKIFYTCSSEQCNFISWGRPHHIPCARCKNPFTVEVEDAHGQIVLKCPRATCQHRQPLAPPPGSQTGAAVRKVVRKRLVRRKT